MSRPINKVILHCSASNIPAHNDIAVIDKWHEERGFSCTLDDGTVIHVGYHYFIQTDGTVQNGRPESKIGAHCKDYNRDSIGICLHGKEVKDFTPEQFKSLAKVINGILAKHPNCTIHGHNEFANKACPVFDVDEFVDEYMS